MKRYVAYLAFILVAAPVESTLPRLPLLHGVHVLLLVPLVFFFALQLNTIEGLFLSYAVGFVEDATISYVTGLAAFSMVALFIGARLALMAVKTDGPFFEALFCFVLAAAFFALTYWTRRLREPGLIRITEGWFSMYLSACMLTALVTPLITRVARRIERLQAKSPGAL